MTRRDPPPVADSRARAVARGERRAAKAFLQDHGTRLWLLFLGLLLPMWGFLELADELQDEELAGFDSAVLGIARDIASKGFDQWFLLFSELGYAYGVVPFDIALVVALAWRRRFRESIFAAVSLGGSALLNMATKQLFARDRPSLWESIAPESTYSFPSGHAMGSMTLAMVLVLLAWPTRWRWPTVGAMAFFVVMVGLSRVYLGVHFPSDIAAGWLAASVWAVGCYGLAFQGGHRPWKKPAPA